MQRRLALNRRRLALNRRRLALNRRRLALDWRQHSFPLVDSGLLQPFPASNSPNKPSSNSAFLFDIREGRASRLRGIADWEGRREQGPPGRRPPPRQIDSASPLAAGRLLATSSHNFANFDPAVKLWR